MNTILLHLSLIDGIGAGSIARLLAHKPNAIDVSVFYDLSESEFMKFCGLSQAMATKIVAGLSDEKILNHELALIEKHHISWTTIIDDNYPQSLKNIHMPPPVIYWQGTQLYNNENSIAFVGSRAANTYAQHVIDHLIPPLIEENWTIISGGALGADSMAHQTTINYGGNTIVVLGSGLLNPQPISNKKLFNEVVASGGTIISIFPLTMQGFPQNFPARNRIISGLSRGIVVVQAARKSGALITAKFALEQGREIFAVPGAINDPLSAGCHDLIAQGAKVVTMAGDILTEFGIHIDENKDEKGAREIVSIRKISKQKSQDNVTNSSKIVTHRIDDNDITPQSIILINCAKNPCSIDELLNLTGLDIADLNIILFNLQIENKLIQSFTGLWQIK
jgi:DNA processing protein